MSKTVMIQVRNVPEKLHRELVKRAKGQGLSLTDYITRVLQREVGVSSKREAFDRFLSHAPVDLGGMAAAEAVRDARRWAAEYGDHEAEDEA